MGSPIDGGDSCSSVGVRGVAFENEAGICDQAVDHMKNGVAVVCCFHMSRNDLLDVMITKGPYCDIDDDVRHYRILGIQVVRVVCGLLHLGSGNQIGNRLYDSIDYVCLCSCLGSFHLESENFLTVNHVQTPTRAWLHITQFKGDETSWIRPFRAPLESQQFNIKHFVFNIERCSFQVVPKNNEEGFSCQIEVEQSGHKSCNDFLPNYDMTKFLTLLKIG